MQHRSRATAPVLALMLALAPACGHAAPQFKPSALPPPDSPQAAPSLYDVFQTGETSPLGTSASTVKPSKLMDEAASYLNGSDGHQENFDEAMFWLKRAVRLAPDDGGKRRAWALTNLGQLLYSKGDATAHASGRYVLQIAGAWNDGAALCDLGQLAELGDDVAAPDHEMAVAWYKRAKEAGCAQADSALARLQR